MAKAHADIVRAAAGKDARSVDTLVERHLPGLVAFVRARAGARLKAREATVDLVQSACREVLEDLSGREPGDEAAFRHWLYQAAERKIVDRARYHAAEKRSPEREIPLGSEADLLRQGYSGFWTPSRDAAAREELGRVEATLARLPEDYREVIVLARIVGLSHAEVAERLERSEGAVRILLHRALARLALEMRAAGGGR